MKAITHLRGFRAKNFKAIQDSKMVTFTPLTVLIGNNGSGKSSLIEAMETYRSIVVDGLDKAMERWFGFEHILNKGTRRRTRFSDASEMLRHPMYFGWSGRFPVNSGTGEMLITARSGFSSILIEKEVIRQKDKLVTRRADGQCVTDWFGKAVHQIDTFETGRSVLSRGARDMVAGWQFLSLSPDPMGRPTPTKLAVDGRLMLNRDGSNIAQYLLEIRKKDPSAFEVIVEKMQFILDYAKNFEPVESQEIHRTMYLQMREEGFEIPGWLISTGTIRALALLAVLNNPDPPRLLVIEEIEDGLDPRTLNLLVAEIRNAIEDGRTQVIATTHSPYLLDLLDLSHLIFVERVDGAPVFRRPDSQAIVRQWAATFAPGQLYTMGKINSQKAAAITIPEVKPGQLVTVPPMPEVKPRQLVTMGKIHGQGRE